MEPPLPKPRKGSERPNPSARAPEPGLLPRRARGRGPAPRPRPRTLPGPTPRPFAPLPASFWTRTAWKRVARLRPRPSGGAPGVAGAGEGSGERGRPDLLRGGGARLRRALRAAEAPPSPGPNPPAGPPDAALSPRRSRRLGLPPPLRNQLIRGRAPAQPAPAPPPARTPPAARLEAWGRGGRGNGAARACAGPAAWTGSGGSRPPFLSSPRTEVRPGLRGERLERAPPSGAGAIGRRRLRKTES
ncbi:uncharacterized protein LOC116558997 [Sapajus apella]|uniref:Uncharacterized protein LOC116558997 n=1 Tax=Sapajus apella TaxID=9515 RepID=A0A6J3IT32_SAPAP|nr:uncharacterized protein LOC116558997 [Sapajus apella]